MITITLFKCKSLICSTNIFSRPQYLVIRSLGGHLMDLLFREQRPHPHTSTLNRTIAAAQMQNSTGARGVNEISRQFHIIRKWPSSAHLRTDWPRTGAGTRCTRTAPWSRRRCPSMRSWCGGWFRGSPPWRPDTRGTAQRRSSCPRQLSRTARTCTQYSENC